MDTRDELANEGNDLVEDLIDRAAQAGRDQMAKVLLGLLLQDLQETVGGSEDYRSGIRDAIDALVQHGASKPES